VICNLNKRRDVLPTAAAPRGGVAIEQIWELDDAECFKKNRGAVGIQRRDLG
jgi:hypothetical protein